MEAGKSSGRTVKFGEIVSGFPKTSPGTKKARHEPGFPMAPAVQELDGEADYAASSCMSSPSASPSPSAPLARRGGLGRGCAMWVGASGFGGRAAAGVRRRE